MRLTHVMQTVQQTGAGVKALEPGQLWKLEHGYLHVGEVGKRCAHYKIMRQPDQKSVITRLIGIGQLVTYLKQSEARLVA